MREKGERKSASCNKWRVRDDRACDPIFSPLRFWAGFSVRSLCDMCDVNLISLRLCCCLAVSDPLSSITGLGDETIDVASHLFARPFSHYDPGL